MTWIIQEPWTVNVGLKIKINHIFCHYKVISFKISSFLPPHPLAPPKINLDLLRDVITLKAGSTLRIPVEFTGCPPPFIEWYHQSRRMADDTRTTIEDRDDRTLLTVTNTKREDTGVYSVTVVNEAGRHSGKIRVNVTGKFGMIVCLKDI